jgi:hypothetical protein
VTQQPTSPRIWQAVSLQCLDARGRSLELPAELGWDPTDPYAVAVAFGWPGTTVCWLVGRDLLIDGLTHPAGEGDVLLWPSIDENGRAAVVVELCSPNGRLVAQLSTRELRAFLDRTLVAVPQGTGWGDVDDLFDALTSDPE